MSEKRLPDEKLKHYEDVIKSEKEETLKVINHINDLQRRGVKNRSGDSSSYSFHQADQGTDTDEMEKEVYLLEEENKKLKALNQALKRIYDKTYGICELCGCYIPEVRLKIIPFAKYCIECKSKEETKKNKK